MKSDEANQLPKPPSSRSLALKRYHASRTPEQRAERSARISLFTRAGMYEWHAGRTDAEREQSRQAISDAALSRTWAPKTPGNKFRKGHKPVANTTPEALARRTLTQVRNASVERILADIVGTQPELLYDAIIEGLKAAPPRSFPYIGLAAAYLDGRPIDAPPPEDNRPDLSELTRDQLLARALEVARRLQAEAPQEVRNGLPVIDVIPEAGE